MILVVLADLLIVINTDLQYHRSLNVLSVDICPLFLDLTPSLIFFFLYFAFSIIHRRVAKNKESLGTLTTS